MDYEKKHKREIVRATQLWECGDITKENLEYIFPELKESEDECVEKIKKDIISYLNNRQITSIAESSATEKWLAWLEKQGNKPQGKTALEAIKEEKVDNANKIKPKFQNGQWIVWQNKYYKVNDNGCGYELVDQNGLSTSLEYGTVDKNAHIWDITKDARVGDVLASKDELSILIFRNLDTSTSFSSYYNIQRKGELGWSNECFIPATKEQRDTLMKAMADAGYTFDFDKKELKKIEQAPTWSEKIKGLNELETYILSLVPDRSLDTIKVDAKNIRYIINKEQKSAWSEEDEKMVLSIEQIVQCTSLLNIVPEKVKNWFKSIKNRVEHQSKQ